ncbi:hypothetical protein SEA_VINCENZO_3 [Mycobacterium phage Vincenzo]|uniref:Uncharacterized protein n=2 Tax=Coopervirus vincenzo TaxID=1983110 RepID=A0A0F6WDU7_9CAUD|nr:hypothetical protein SEA_VINCENZO_3 [Mycobacterium phage Vincenzo]AKF14265.1 hypothetical protein SEA_VINCENZO_3 [Mycobacterium phage Vincenzo]AKF14668.1 hypothetical protein SEA_ALANGRANT_3 [Mycobacterium phage AlanGrant]
MDAPERDHLDDQARADLPGLTPRERHLTPVRCTRCAARVYTYASSADGLRHYCRCIAWLPAA